TRASATRSVRLAARDSGSRDAMPIRATSFPSSVNLIVPRLICSRAHPWPLAEVTLNVTRSPSHELRIANRQPKGTLPWSKLVKYDLFDVFNVPPHRRLCRLGIVALDRSQDPAVACERPFGAAFQLQ